VEKAWDQQSTNLVLRALPVNQSATPEAQKATVDAKLRASAENETAHVKENKKASEEVKVVSWKKSPVLPTSGACCIHTAKAATHTAPNNGINDSPSVFRMVRKSCCEEAMVRLPEGASSC
jgi:hypothetical protein